MNIKIGILNVPKHCNKHDLIHFVTVSKTKLCKNGASFMQIGLKQELLKTETIKMSSWEPENQWGCDITSSHDIDFFPQSCLIKVQYS